MDTTILNAIKKTEKDYRIQIKKFLADKENELIILLKNLEKKNLSSQAKDNTIMYLKECVKKIEYDGLKLLE